MQEVTDSDALEQFSDSELIELFKKDCNERAFSQLVRRHNSRIHGRFRSKISNASDADDLCQQLWIRVVENIDTYNDAGRFPHYVSTIASNLLRDYWRERGVRDGVDTEWPEDDAALDRNMDYQSHNASAEETIGGEQAVQQLVTKLIPNLPVEQRTIYLLRHESEHWETKEPMQWEHLARLNGIDVDTAWQRFDNARRQLLSEQNMQLKDSEEGCVFFVWTQAQRPHKQANFTENDFSEMLNVPVNTLKTRYRSAIKKLAEDLTTLGLRP